MKKIISLIVVLLFAMTFVLTGNTYAAALTNLEVNVSEITVRPGEEVTLSISFGESLGAYTFDIAYDDNIFEYVSVDGGTANDTSDKVRVTFHDSTGGTNPRENMSIVFRAKADITTSNPTELTVTGEGLANADASVNYDDITTPITKNITVEPEYQDYVINLEYTGDIVVNQEKDMVLSYSSSMGKYYEHARLIAEATTPDNGNVQLIATDGVTKAEQDIIQSGWGDPQGYKIGGKDVSQVLNVKALFTAKGDYTVTLKLIDRDNSDAVIAEKAFSFTAGEETITTPPEETPGETPSETPDENTNETVEEETTNQTNEAAKPTKLPKTGNDIFMPIAILVISLLSAIFYFKVKR